MKFLFVGFILLTGYSISIQSNETYSTPDYIEGELLVKLKEGISEEKANKIIKEKDAKIIKVIKDLKIYHIKLKKGQSVKGAMKEFLEIDEVEYVEPNYKTRKVR